MAVSATDARLELRRNQRDTARGAAVPPRRAGIALCLSGGGYRAAIFHCGAMLRLHQAGILPDVGFFSAVSGGSIAQAWLATRYLSQRGPGQSFAQWCAGTDFLDAVITPFRQVVAADIRTGPVLATLLHNWKWPQHRMRMLERRYARHFGDTTLAQLPDDPSFVFCATDLTFGVNWEFGRQRVGDYLAGYLRDPGGIPLARAVAASSSFPPVFGPMRLALSADDFKRRGYRGEDGDDLRRRIDLTDGGVYDNLATEPVLRNAAVVLISDAGAPFAFSTERGYRRLLRYTQVVGNQAESLRKRMFFLLRSQQVLDGTYWGLASRRRKAGAGYPGALVADVIGRMRTDLDRFRRIEFDVLLNHGYFSCHNALQAWPGAPASAKAPGEWPCPDAADEADVRRQLESSHRRIFHARWFGGRRG